MKKEDYRVKQSSNRNLISTDKHRLSELIKKRCNDERS